MLMDSGQVWNIFPVLLPPYLFLVYLTSRWYIIPKSLESIKIEPVKSEESFSSSSLAIWDIAVVKYNALVCAVSFKNIVANAPCDCRAIESKANDEDDNNETTSLSTNIVVNINANNTKSVHNSLKFFMLALDSSSSFEPKECLVWNGDITSSILGIELIMRNNDSMYIIVILSNGDVQFVELSLATWMIKLISTTTNPFKYDARIYRASLVYIRSYNRLFTTINGVIYISSNVLDSIIETNHSLNFISTGDNMNPDTTGLLNIIVKYGKSYKSVRGDTLDILYDNAQLATKSNGGYTGLILTATDCLTNLKTIKYFELSIPNNSKYELIIAWELILTTTYVTVHVPNESTALSKSNIFYIGANKTLYICNQDGVKYKINISHEGTIKGLLNFTDNLQQTCLLVSLSSGTYLTYKFPLTYPTSSTLIPSEIYECCMQSLTPSIDAVLTHSMLPYSTYIKLLGYNNSLYINILCYHHCIGIQTQTMAISSEYSVTKRESGKVLTSYSCDTGILTNSQNELKITKNKKLYSYIDKDYSNGLKNEEMSYLYLEDNGYTYSTIDSYALDTTLDVGLYKLYAITGNSSIELIISSRILNISSSITISTLPPSMKQSSWTADENTVDVSVLSKLITDEYTVNFYPLENGYVQICSNKINLNGRVMPYSLLSLPSAVAISTSACMLSRNKFYLLLHNSLDKYIYVVAVNSSLTGEPVLVDIIRNEDDVSSLSVCYIQLPVLTYFSKCNWNNSELSLYTLNGSTDKITTVISINYSEILPTMLADIVVQHQHVIYEQGKHENSIDIVCSCNTGVVFIIRINPDTRVHRLLHLFPLSVGIIKQVSFLTPNSIYLNGYNSDVLFRRENEVWDFDEVSTPSHESNGPVISLPSSNGDRNCILWLQQEPNNSACLQKGWLNTKVTQKTVCKRIAVPGRFRNMELIHEDNHPKVPLFSLVSWTNGYGIFHTYNLKCVWHTDDESLVAAGIGLSPSRYLPAPNNITSYIDIFTLHAARSNDLIVVTSKRLSYDDNGFNCATVYGQYKHHLQGEYIKFHLYINTASTGAAVVTNTRSPGVLVLVTSTNSLLVIGWKLTNKLLQLTCLDSICEKNEDIVDLKYCMHDDTTYVLVSRSELGIDVFRLNDTTSALIHVKNITVSSCSCAIPYTSQNTSENSAHDKENYILYIATGKCATLVSVITVISHIIQ